MSALLLLGANSSIEAADSSANSAPAASPPQSSPVPSVSTPITTATPVPGVRLSKAEYEAINAIPDDDPPGTVRLIGAETDIGKKYKFMVPPLPVYPFTKWRKWWDEHEISVHCALEWKDASGKWFYAEMRNAKWDTEKEAVRVGLGQFPGTGYIAYSIYIFPGRIPRVIDQIGRPMVITLNEVIKVDYRLIESEIRRYGAYGKTCGDPGTGKYGKENCGLGGPAYKPAQNSNTLISYVLRRCGVERPAPDRAVGWDTIPLFPYSSNLHYPKYGDY